MLRTTPTPTELLTLDEARRWQGFDARYLPRRVPSMLVTETSDPLRQFGVWDSTSDGWLDTKVHPNTPPWEPNP